ncbi:MAG: alpha/beta fold hydrolase [Panacagrimonas sp.]
MPFIKVNGIDLHYLDEGQGEPLLLIHNLTSNVAGFEHNIPVLAKRYRVIAPDLRGHGLTTHCESYEDAPGFYTFDHLSEDITQLLAALNVDRFLMFGQAFWGVSTALSLYERMPTRIRGIALSATSMIPSHLGEKPYEKLGEVGKRNFLRMRELARSGGMMAVYQDRLSSGQFWSQKVLNSPSILEAFAEAHRLTSPVAFVQIPHFSHERRNAVCAALARHRTPVMLLLGEQDSHNKHSIEVMRRDYPDTHVTILSDCGHYPTIENPSDFNRALLNFCAGVERDAIA